MRKEVLQKFIDENGEYLIGNRYVEGMGASRGKDEWYPVFLSPNIDRDLWGKKIGELPYDKVVEFADKDIMTNIHLGGTYPPFQYGIKYKDFIDITKVECNPNELIDICYKEKITDYYKVIEKMKLLSTLSNNEKDEK